MPQLRETGLNRLPYLREQELLCRRIRACDEQDLSLLLKQGSGRLASIAQVSERHSTVARFAQREQRVTVIYRAGRQHEIEKASRNMAQTVQFEAKEPTLRSFPEACAILPHQTHSPMSQRVAQRNRLGINQIEGGVLFTGAGRLQQQAN